MTTTTNNNVNEEERNTSDSPVVEALTEYFYNQGYITRELMTVELEEMSDADR